MDVPVSVPQDIDNQLLCRILSFGETVATLADMTIDCLLDVCEAPTVQEAMVSGDKFD
ncbi:hypothetical protein [Agrobacterium tomkonis]|uniref:hypothetical protein n=1 Tax=Agrobacterium tomkonis TaxID=1183410 RepID=UPI001CD8D971